jgi:hypothetical protein
MFWRSCNDIKVGIVCDDDGKFDVVSSRGARKPENNRARSPVPKANTPIPYAEVIYVILHKKLKYSINSYIQIHVYYIYQVIA